MTSALLTRAVAHDQTDETHPLLNLSWLDVSGTPLEAGAATTADQALAKLLADEWEQQYQDWIEHLQGEHPTPTIDPFDPTIRAKLDTQAQAIATNRLDQYEQRLRNFLQTEPTDEELADWLANRAMQDAATWARLDASEIRHDAANDFYQANPELRHGRYTIEPLVAAEPKCQAIAGEEFESYQDAADALDNAWHFGCIHFISPIDE